MRGEGRLLQEAQVLLVVLLLVVAVLQSNGD
jgi:hypothetical protein